MLLVIGRRGFEREFGWGERRDMIPVEGLGSIGLL
jgi:hypothetical protein